VIPGNGGLEQIVLRGCRYSHAERTKAFTPLEVVGAFSVQFWLAVNNHRVGLDASIAGEHHRAVAKSFTDFGIS